MRSLALAVAVMCLATTTASAELAVVPVGESLYALVGEKGQRSPTILRITPHSAS